MEKILQDSLFSESQLGSFQQYRFCKLTDVMTTLLHSRNHLSPDLKWINHSSPDLKWILSLQSRGIYLSELLHVYIRPGFTWLQSCLYLMDIMHCLHFIQHLDTSCSSDISSTPTPYAKYLQSWDAFRIIGTKRLLGLHGKDSLIQICCIPL